MKKAEKERSRVQRRSMEMLKSEGGAKERVLKKGPEVECQPNVS